MFIANLSNGSTVTEKTDENPQGVYWDDMPNVPITALHLTLPVQVKARQPDGTVIDMPAPVVTLSQYTRYYFANQAVSMVFAVNPGGGTVGDGRGTLTHQIIAGIDDEHDLVVYIEVDRKSNVQIKRFPVSQLKVSPDVLKLGVVK